MPYINIYERSQLFDLDIEYELNNIKEKFKGSIPIFIAIFHKRNFKDYIFRNHATTFKEYLHLNYDKVLLQYEGNHEYQYKFIAEFLMNLYNYLETLSLYNDTYNYSSVGQRNHLYDYYYLYFERVNKILSLLGCKFKFINHSDDENYDPFEPTYAILIETNSLAEKIASLIPNKKIKFDILKFNHYNISMDEKQVLIEDMYKYFEGIRRDSVSTVANTLASLMNNGLRHDAENKIKNKDIQTYINKDKDRALNEAYDLLIECFYHSNNLSVIKKVKSLIPKD